MNKAAPIPRPIGDGERPSPGRWTQGTPPDNVRLGPNTVVTDDLAFKRFHSNAVDALIIGANCTMDGVHFDLGLNGRMVIGDYCYFTNAVLLCELEVRILSPIPTFIHSRLLNASPTQSLVHPWAKASLVHKF